MKSQNAYGTDLNTPTVEFITLLTLSFYILYESDESHDKLYIMRNGYK